MYYSFVADWLRVFPAEQVMAIRYEDYVAKPSEIINNVCKFLGICELSRSHSVLFHRVVMFHSRPFCRTPRTS